MGRANPLEVPEIVSIVLSHLTKKDGHRLSNKSLIASAQVNRLWFELVTSIIWSDSDLLYGKTSHMPHQEPQFIAER